MSADQIDQALPDFMAPCPNCGHLWGVHDPTGCDECSCGRRACIGLIAPDTAVATVATDAESSRQRAVKALDRALEAGGIYQPFVKWGELIEALEAEGWEFRAR